MSQQTLYSVVSTYFQLLDGLLRLFDGPLQLIDLIHACTTAVVVTVDSE